MTRNRFCWTWGVGAWGLTTGVIFAVVMSRTNDTELLPWLVMSLLLFPAGGYFWGRIMWRWFGKLDSEECKGGR